MEHDQSHRRWQWGVRVAWVVMVTGALLASPARGQIQDEWATLPELEGAVGQCVQATEEFVDWAHRKKLLAERDRACEFLLTLDPDCRVARKHLGYKRTSSGGWERVGYAAPVNKSSSALEEAPARKRAALAPYYDALLAYWMEERGGLGERGEVLVARLLELDSNHAGLRAELGEVWDEVRGTWVLRETLRSVGQRREYLAMLRAFANEVALEKDARPTTDEQRWALPGWRAVETPRLRVSGTVTQQELIDCALAVAASQRWLETLCAPAKPLDRLHLVLLQSEDELRTLFENEPKLAGADLAFALRAAGTWVPQSYTFAACSGERAQRVELALQQALRWALEMNYGVETEQSWVFQGLQIYASTLTLGRSGALEEDARATDASAAPGDEREGWSAAITEVLDRTSGRWLGPIGSARGQMSRDVLMRCFVWTRFLMEAAPEHTCGWLARTLAEGGAMGGAEMELRSSEGTELEQRVLRWAAEVGAGSAPAQIELGPNDLATLLAALADMPAAERKRLYERCVAAVEACGARQLELVATWSRGLGSEVGKLPSATEFQAHDANHFKGGPPRRVEPEGTERWLKLREKLPDELPEPWSRQVVYEFASGKIVRAEAPAGQSETWAFENLLAGVPPGMDVAEALLLSRLDHERSFNKEAEYFAHLYCDRDARAYEGISLFDVWSNKVGLEVPDPDARAFAIKIYQDDSVPVPLSDADHDLWYPRIAMAIDALRTHIRLSRALATIYFNGRPTRIDGGYETSIDILHAFWASLDEDVERAQQRLVAEEGRLIGNALAQMEQLGNDGWNAGNARRDELEAGARQIRQATLAVLRDEHLLP